MRLAGRTVGCAALATALAVALTGSAQAATGFGYMQGFKQPDTPEELNRIGVLKVGPKRAQNILVLVPGTSASASYFRPLAQQVVRDVRRRTGERWRVWAVERRENQLEDHSMLDRLKRGRALGRDVFDYYLGYLADPSVAEHFELIPDSQVGFAAEWGMRVAVRDLRRVVTAAKRTSRKRARLARQRGRGKVVLGGHSLGGSITTAYASWDFRGRPGARGLAGLVFIDGGSNPFGELDAAGARDELAELRAGSPWLSFGGIPAPYAGLFSMVSAALVRTDPDGPSLLVAGSHPGDRAVQGQGSLVGFEPRHLSRPPRRRPQLLVRPQLRDRLGEARVVGAVGGDQDVHRAAQARVAVGGDGEAADQQVVDLVGGGGRRGCGGRWGWCRGGP